MSKHGDMLTFRCPGCRNEHHVPIDKGVSPTWSWNGDLDKPTLSPSLHVKMGHYVGGPSQEECGFCKREASGGSKSPCLVCHSFVVDGRIQFLGDCTHALAGQTVDLPEIVS